MSTLIAMCVWDTEENKRTEYTERTLNSLRDTVDLDKHELFIVDNNSCKATKDMFQNFTNSMGQSQIISLSENIGTARGINKAWFLRNPGQHCIKMDNDVVINQSGWVEEMEAAIERDNQIGIIGLKRKDVWQYPGHADPNLKSELIMLPHKNGEPWIVVERCADIIGTCTMFNSDLLDKVGYSFQPGIYGYEDTLFCHRSHLAGFYNCFLPHINIDHIDTGATPYQHWKEKHSGEHTKEMIEIFKAYVNGTRPIYEPIY